LFWAYPAGPKKAAKTVRATRKLSKCRFSRIAPHFSEIFKTVKHD
ncbi:MAG: hypothetical protein ACI90V_006774, partial [Bacillariaceae sp.]